MSSFCSCVNSISSLVHLPFSLAVYLRVLSLRLTSNINDPLTKFSAESFLQSAVFMEKTRNLMNKSMQF